MGNQIKKKRKGKETLEADSTGSNFFLVRSQKRKYALVVFLDEGNPKARAFETTRTVYGQKGQIKKQARDGGKSTRKKRNTTKEVAVELDCVGET